MVEGGTDSFLAARPLTAAAARGHWILDSGASEHLVSKGNLSKRDLRDMSHDGEPVTLSTANGLVERKSRAKLELPKSTGDAAPVHAIVMDGMADLNLCSMGRLVAEQHFASFWSPGGGHLWRDPKTLTWVRLRVDNHVPVLELADDQTGITEALRGIFAGVEPAPGIVPDTMAAPAVATPVVAVGPTGNGELDTAAAPPNEEDLHMDGHATTPPDEAVDLAEAVPAPPTAVADQAGGVSTHRRRREEKDRLLSADAISTKHLLTYFPQNP